MAAGRRAIDVARLVAEEAGAKRMIEQGIDQPSALAGELRDAVIQGDFSGKNWWYALGNVNLFRYQIAHDEAARAENARLIDGTARVHLEVAGGATTTRRRTESPAPVRPGASFA